MVKHDSSARSVFEDSSAEPRLAPVSDRLLSFLIDFMIFSPVLSLLGAGLLREVRTYLLLQSESPEAAWTWILFVAWTAVCTVVLQALCFKIWSATPGQKFMQLQVRSYPDGARELGWAQSFLRAIFWGAGFALGSIPFLSVFIHSRRRALHDRASDTIVVTLKEEGDPGPIDVEARFFASVVRAVVLVVATAALAAGFRLKSMVASGDFSHVARLEEGRLCERVPASLTGTKRLDTALALYFASQVDAECLDKEADEALWNKEGAERNFGALIRYFLEDDLVKKKKYRELACADAGSEACGLVAYNESKDDDRGNLLRKAGLSTLSARYLLMQESLDNKEFLSAISLIEDLQGERGFSTAVAKPYVRAVWGLNEERKEDGRRPASEETDRVFRSFKERFEIE